MKASLPRFEEGITKTSVGFRRLIVEWFSSPRVFPAGVVLDLLSVAGLHVSHVSFSSILLFSSPDTQCMVYLPIHLTLIYGKCRYKYD